MRITLLFKGNLVSFVNFVNSSSKFILHDKSAMYAPPPQIELCHCGGSFSNVFL